MRQIYRHIEHWIEKHTDRMQCVVVILICVTLLTPYDLLAAVDNHRQFHEMESVHQREQVIATPSVEEQTGSKEERVVEEIPAQSAMPVDTLTTDTLKQSVVDRDAVVTDSIVANSALQSTVETDSVLTVVTADDMPAEFSAERRFNPNPTRAVWLSALLPGLGQLYNRRYWKLPIVVGGFMGLGYATAWNNNQLRDYTQGYRDLTDSDPATNSYMNFFPPTTQESDFDKQWLTNIMKSRKDYYRRNRDLCIICLVGLYLLCMVDAYVDASLAHFDITDNLSMDLQPALFTAPVDNKMMLGMNCAINF